MSSHEALLGARAQLEEEVRRRHEAQEVARVAQLESTRLLQQLNTMKKVQQSELLAVQQQQQQQRNVEQVCGEAECSWVWVGLDCSVEKVCRGAGCIWVWVGLESSVEQVCWRLLVGV